eukprot:TRINITY_DN669_c0_g1_i1.p1 TRINITY_DN669_c0_g1~~TRINITY_DN669_c0_g1_i1.p1  ORF type:complete len:243 (-),score=52.13 TRINITY_DN669_c0_g1_i1:16-744(-)
MLVYGRIQTSHLESINSVCDAIKAPFTYGLIINQVPAEVEEKWKQAHDLDICLKLLHKQPSSTLILPEVASLRNKDDVLLDDEQVRNKIMNFLNNLQANFIKKEEVEHIDTRGIEERVKELDAKYDKLLQEEKRLREEAEVRRRREEERRIESERAYANSIRSVEDEFKVETSNPVERIASTERKSHWKRDTVWTNYQTIQKKDTYRRTKTTRNSGAVEYSGWTLVSSQQEVIGSRQTQHHE